MEPYLKPAFGVATALRIQKRFAWTPNQLDTIVTGITFDGFDTTEDVLAPPCSWVYPTGAGYTIVAAFPLYNADESAVLNYLCYEVMFTNETNVSYDVSYRWTIRQPGTGLTLVTVLGSALTTNYVIPSGTDKTLGFRPLFFSWGYFGLNLYIGFTVLCMGTYKYGGNTWAYNLPASICIRPDLIGTMYGHFSPEKSVTQQDDPNEDPNQPGGGYSGEGGGNGDHDWTQDNIPIPGQPPLSATDAGFVHVFKLNTSQMQIFAEDLMDPDIWAALKQLLSNPMDFIASLSILPFEPVGTQTAKPKFGLITWAHAYHLVSNQYKDIDCGSYTVPKFYNTALDYDPLTRLRLYLPFIGYKPISADEAMGNTIHILYRIDVLTGDLICFVEITSTDNGSTRTQVCYQFTGNCAVQIPYSRTSYDTAVRTGILLLTAGVGGAIGLAAGGGAGLAAASSLNAGQIASQVSGAAAVGVQAAKPTLERGGALSANAGMMGVMYPYLIREIPRQSLPEQYRELCGYPSNIGGTLGSFPGHTAVESIKLECSATDEEKQMIIDLLRGGVYV